MFDKRQDTCQDRETISFFSLTKQRQKLSFLLGVCDGSQESESQSQMFDLAGNLSHLF